MDFIGGLPKAMGKDTILVVVDRFTKYAHFFALAHPYNAKEVAELFVREVVKLHGFPTSIVSDRDRVFLSTFWSEMFKLAGTKLKFSSAYHPQTDGQTEVVNRCVETYLRCVTGLKPKQWPKWLCWAEFWYNTNYHSAIKTTPFKALYGREPPVIIRGNDSLTSVDEVEKMTAERNLIIDELKENLEKAQNRMKQQANKHRRDVQYEVGDLVYLKIQPYKLKSLARRKNQKLSPRYYGPFPIIEKINPAAYKLKLPEDSQAHPVFHISLLKKALNAGATSQPLPVSLTEDWELKVEPESIQDSRAKTDGDLEVLVRWKDLPEFEDSWEDFNKLLEQFPDHQLEDKLILQGGRDVANPRTRPRFGNVYNRRPKMMPAESPNDHSSRM